MKIVVLANSSSGLYGFRKELLEELLKEHEVYICVPNGECIDKMEKIGCKFIDTPIDRRGINPKTDFSLYRRYKSILKQIKPNLVITYTIKPNVYGGFACKKLEISYAINITGLGTAFQKKGMLRKLVIFMYKISLKKAKVVFFENCENMQIFIDEKIINKQQACLLNGAGVNLETHTLLEYPKDCQTTRFLFMGRVMKEKGIDELFEAMKKLIADGIECSLEIIGGLEENYSDIIKKYESEGWLFYSGHQSNVQPFIENCHCSVLPSWHEGMSNTNLECAASGRPVITSNIHGCLEAVEDGISGYLCEKKNSDDLYRVMKKFTELSYEERQRMGLAGRKHMEDVFDKKKVVKRTIDKL
jgi:galacturonosyltransferase